MKRRRCGKVRSHERAAKENGAIISALVRTRGVIGEWGIGTVMTGSGGGGGDAGYVPRP